jgi:aldehyde dehydrogenase (NAD+)
MITRNTFFIGARWVRPAGWRSIRVVSPITEEPIGRVPDSTSDDIDQAVSAARRAFDVGPCPRMSLSERGRST